MALLSIDGIVNRAITALKKTLPPGGLEILSYKRNRGVSVLRLEEDRYLVRERGYEAMERELPGAELPRLLKTAIKREFPRSRKLRIYALSGPEALDQERKRL